MALSASGLILYGSFLFAKGILKGTSRPMFVMWLLFEVGVITSFFTYLASEHPTLIANVVNLTDIVSVTAVFAVAVRCGGRKQWQFERLPGACLMVALGILAWWVFHRQDFFWAHYATQLIFVVAYVPPAFHFWNAASHTEDPRYWQAMIAASALGFILACSRWDLMPMIYSGRSACSSLLMLLFLIRIERKRIQGTR